MKLKLSWILIGVIFLFLPLIGQASQTPVDIYLFWSQGCPHCSAEEAFLWELAEADNYQGKLNIKLYEINQPGSLQALKLFAEKLDFQPSGVPITIIGDQYLVGFATAATTGQQIKKLIDQQLSSAVIEPTIDSHLTHLPLLGEMDLSKISLPLLTVIIGLLDGFNPCAMWALLFLLSLLLGMQNRRRMWILGSAFIAASGLVYFIFMAAWLNIILFIGMMWWLRIIIGLVALAGGSWNLKKFFKDKDSGCAIAGQEKRRRVLDKLKNIAGHQKLWLALAGIIALSFTINLVEMVCSAGLPAVYTQVLVMNNLPVWQYYGYLLLYIFFFLLNNLAVFFAAMITLRLTGLSTKYSRWSALIGGLLMVIIGLLLIFKHEWLMFV